MFRKTPYPFAKFLRNFLSCFPATAPGQPLQHPSTRRRESQAGGRTEEGWRSDEDAREEEEAKSKSSVSAQVVGRVLMTKWAKFSQAEISKKTSDGRVFFLKFGSTLRYQSVILGSPSWTMASIPPFQKRTKCVFERSIWSSGLKVTIHFLRFIFKQPLISRCFSIV